MKGKSLTVSSFLPKVQCSSGEDQSIPSHPWGRSIHSFVQGRSFPRIRKHQSSGKGMVLSGFRLLSTTQGTRL